MEVILEQNLEGKSYFRRRALNGQVTEEGKQEAVGK
jgi:hypothetical protein